MRVSDFPNGLDLESFRRIMTTQANDTNNSNPDRQLYRRLAGLIGRINTNGDEFISLPEIEAVARLGGNGTDNNLIETQDLDNLVDRDINPQQPPVPTSIPLEDISNEERLEGIRGYRILHTPRTLLVADNALMVTNRTDLGTVRLQGNTLCTFFLDKDFSLHVLVYQANNFNSNNSLIREYSIPIWSLERTLGHRIRRHFSNENGDKYDPTNGNLLRDFIFSSTNTQRLLTIGQLDFSRLHAIPGVEYREHSGLNGLRAMTFSRVPNSPIDTNRGEELQPIRQIQADSIPPAFQAAPTLITNDTETENLFNNYYSGEHRIARLGSNIPAENITNSRLFRVSGNRIAQLIRIQLPGSNPTRYEFRLLVKHTHSDNDVRFEEYRLPQEAITALATQCHESINPSNFNTVFNFIGRRLRADEDVSSAWLYNQRGYIQLGSLLGRNFGTTETPITVQVRSSRRDSGNNDFSTWFGPTAFQNAVTSMTSTNRHNSLTWLNRLTSYNPSEGISSTQMPQGATNIPTTVTQFSDRLRSNLAFRNNDDVRANERIRRFYPNIPESNRNQFSRTITQFSIYNPHTRRIENRLVLLADFGNGPHLHIISWVGNGNANSEYGNTTAYRMCSIPVSQLDQPPFNYRNISSLSLSTNGIVDDLTRERTNYELQQLQVFFGTSNFIENHLTNRTNANQCTLEQLVTTLQSANTGIQACLNGQDPQ